MKRKLFTFTVLLAYVFQAIAGEGGKSPVPAKPGSSNIKKKASNVKPASSLRSSIKDSVDPQSGFHDLYEEAPYTPNGVRLNPKAVSFVQDYMDRNSKNLIKLKDWGRPYFNMMDNILVQYGLPIELKYLAVIESELKSTAVSWAGAVGPWQLMPTTAKGLGLKITKSRDERRDYYKSTHAAAKYLKSLFNEFGDWLLAIAAYNGGPGYVYGAIKKSKSRNFWVLQYYLPAESRNHVKKFISTHYIFEGQGGITTLTKAEASAHLSELTGYMLTRNLTGEELKNAKTITVSGKYHSSVIARYINMDMQEFNRYNPQFDKVMGSANNRYELKLPASKVDLFVANKYNILNESVQLLLSDAASVDAPREIPATGEAALASK